MPEMSPGLVLRRLKHAQQAMKQVRKALVDIRDAEPPQHSQLAQQVVEAGWSSLAHTYKELAAIPLAAASDEVLLKQISVQRYATALLVRLRRVVRNDPKALDGLDQDEG